MYEGGRPSWLFGFMFCGGWAPGGGGRLFVLVLEGCGESEFGRCEGVVVPWGEGEGLLDELLRFEPTRFLKRAFMEFITQKSEELGVVGCRDVKLEAELRLMGTRLTELTRSDVPLQ